MAQNCACEKCQLEHEMKGIPARHIPQIVRTGLSMKLDPIKELPNRDYRFFADKNGITPETRMWLDSQKPRDEPSSICMILNYLCSKHGNNYTVYHVYKTLCEMDSEAQRVILEGMTDIRRMCNQGNRPGQEHSEPPSLPGRSPQPMGVVSMANQASNIPVSSSSHGNISPPPPYSLHGSQQSSHIVGGSSGQPALNDLNVGCSPSLHSNAVSYNGGSNVHVCGNPSGNRNRTRDTGLQQSQTELGRICDHDCVWPSAGEHSFISNDGGVNRTVNYGASTYPHLEFDQHMHRPEAGEMSFYSSDSNAVIRQSYAESENQYGQTFNQARENPQSVTALEELKLPLQGPQIEAGSVIGSLPSAELLTSCQRAGHCARQCSTCQQSVRPVSYPYQLSPSYKSPGSSSRPVSDANYCSHSGACNCLHIANDTSFLPLSNSVRKRLQEQVVPNGSLSGHDASSSNLAWNSPLHQTLIKQPLAAGQGSKKRSDSNQSKTVVQSVNCRSKSEQPMNRTTCDIRENGGQPSNFVFIVAADMEELSQLDQQVAALSQQLQDHGVEHVVVRSTNKWPLVRLSTHTLQKLAPLSNNDPRSVFKFLSHSFQKAAKVLTLITPGYVSYADGYTHGAVEAKTSNQKLIRKIHEELKKEFFDRKAPFRIWPVILHELKANRLHIPKFLSNCLFYNFPYQHGTDDVIELLKMDLYC